MVVVVVVVVVAVAAAAVAAAAAAAAAAAVAAAAIVAAAAAAVAAAAAAAAPEVVAGAVAVAVVVAGGGEVVVVGRFVVAAIRRRRRGRSCVVEASPRSKQPCIQLQEFCGLLFRAAAGFARPITHHLFTCTDARGLSHSHRKKLTEFRYRNHRRHCWRGLMPVAPCILLTAFVLLQFHKYTCHILL